MKQTKLGFLALIGLAAVASIFTVCKATGANDVFQSTTQVKLWNVTFDADGGEPVPEAVAVADGETIGKMPESPKKAPSDFGGWYLDLEGDQFDPETPVTRDITLLAKWLDPPAPGDVRVTFNGAGGSPGIANVDVPEGGTVDPLPTVERTGYYFGGWYPAESETEFTTSTPVNGAITLYAVWAGAQQFTVAPSISLAPGNGQLAWTITASDPEAENYDVYRVSGSQTDAATVKLGTKIAAGTSLAGTITSLTNDQVYSVMVSARKSGHADSDSAIVLAAPAQYAIGDDGPAGGKIFYVDADDTYPGWRYLEAAPENISVEAAWGFEGYNVPGTAPGIGTGQQNTAAMVNNSSSNWVPSAAYLCDTYVYGVFDDWFLPSKDELNEMWKARSSIGVLISWYWSSSQFNTNTSYYQDFSDGKQYNEDKFSALLVCAIRAF